MNQVTVATPPVSEVDALRAELIAQRAELRAELRADIQDEIDQFKREALQANTLHLNHHIEFFIRKRFHRLIPRCFLVVSVVVAIEIYSSPY